jgi:hypothetical protein
MFDFVLFLLMFESSRKYLRRWESLPVEEGLALLILVESKKTVNTNFQVLFFLEKDKNVEFNEEQNGQNLIKEK